MKIIDSLIASIDLQIPGKTFLIGEYAVLKGGACIGFGSSPSFKLVLNNNVVSNSFFNQIHNNSAAGLYLKKLFIENKSEHLELIEILKKGEFLNPYQVGGFGASTAEWIFCKWIYEEFLLKKTNSVKQNRIQNWYESYMDLYLNSYEKPSGADFIIQAVGGLSFIQMKDQIIWKHEQFEKKTDFHFSLFSTSLKVKTHEHLVEVRKNLKFIQLIQDLVQPSQECSLAFIDGDYTQKKESMLEFSRRLELAGLMDAKVIELKNFLILKLKQKFSNFIIKPCGALGVDVFCILTNVEQSLDFNFYVDHLLKTEPQLVNFKKQSDNLSSSLGALNESNINSLKT